MTSNRHFCCVEKENAVLLLAKHSITDGDIVNWFLQNDVKERFDLIEMSGRWYKSRKYYFESQEILHLFLLSFHGIFEVPDWLKNG